MNKVWFLVAAAACCACSSDPCSSAGNGFVLQGSRFPEGVDLQWSGSDAGSYEIWAFGALGQNQFDNPVTTVNTTEAAIGLGPSLGDVRFEARPILAGKACPTPASALTVYGAPSLTAHAVDAGVQLDWSADVNYESGATVGRGPDENDVVAISTVAGSSFLDAAAERGNSYTYIVKVHAPHLDAFSGPVVAQTFPATPVVTATPSAQGGVALAWTQPPSVTGCIVSEVSPPGPDITVMTGSVVAPCPAGVECVYQVRCFDAAQNGSDPATVSGRAAPPPPVLCSATSFSGSVRLTWSPPVSGASQFIVKRRVQMGPEVTLGTVQGTSFEDDTSTLSEVATYLVYSADDNGIFDETAPCNAGAGLRTNVPGPMNVGSPINQVASADLPGQSFVVTSGGQLMGIELAPLGGAVNGGESDCLLVYASGDPRVLPGNCVQGIPMGSAAPFGPDSIQGVYFDLSDQDILVSAGETVAFLFGGSGNAYLEGGDTIPGNATLYGGSENGQFDLLFKAFIAPSTDLPAPMLMMDGEFIWTGSPGATGYDVLDGTGAVLAHTLDTHASVSVSPSSTQPFSVRANGPSSQSATSRPVSFFTGGVQTVVDAGNLCQSASGTVRDEFARAGDDSLTQTFKVLHTGRLRLVEVSVSADLLVTAVVGPFGVPAQVQDAGGAVLASFSLPLATSMIRFSYPFPAISPLVPGPNVVDIQASGVQVTAGETLRLVVGPVPVNAARDLTYRSSPDVYPDGELTLSGSTTGRDLCFKVYVDLPN
jgi:hypothetical protein